LTLNIYLDYTLLQQRNKDKPMNGRSTHIITICRELSVGER